MPRSRLSRQQYTYLSYFLLPLLLVFIAQASGILKQWEWFALDRLLGSRSLEKPDDRIVILGIGEEDIKNTTKNSIDDVTLAKAMQRLAAAKASAIGVDIIRDGEIAPELSAAYRDIPQAIGISGIDSQEPLLPPSVLPPERVGFADYQADTDSLVRRAILARFPQNGKPQYSLAWQVANLYLQNRPLSNNSRSNDRPNIATKISIDRHRLRLNDRSIPPLTTANQSIPPNEGGYFQTIANYRQVYPTFQRISLKDVLEKPVLELEKKVANKIVLIGFTATTKQDFINTSVIPSHGDRHEGSIYGVEYHGHIASQLISTAIEGRSFIQPLPEWGNYLWLIFCIFVSAIFFRLNRQKRPFWHILIILGTHIASIYLLIYLALLAGWWLPVGATAIILAIDMPMLLSFYQRQRELTLLAEKRLQTISESFNAIHNQPLQTLSLLLRDVREEKITFEEITGKLEVINRDIRQIGESLKENSTPVTGDVEMITLGNGKQQDLNTPLEELLEFVYNETLDYEICRQLKKVTKVTDFENFPPNTDLDKLDRMKIGQFLEEAIGNVGKHGVNVTMLKVLGKVRGKMYRLTIEDNGEGEFGGKWGSGSKQAEKLAKHLGGKFSRERRSPHGTICMLEWPLSKPKFAFILGWLTRG